MPPSPLALSPRPVAGRLLATLALLTAVGPLAIDLYIPAFPAMADDLGTTATGIQLTLTAFLIGLGLGQLLIGPLSDAFGRRGPLLAGSLVCLAASVVCAVAPDVEVLVAARFVQGLSGAAGVVLARAIISDTARGALAAKLLGVLMIISVIAPVVAPLAGGGIFAVLGWRAVFWVLAGLVLVMTLMAAWFVRETLPSASRTRGGIGATLRAAGEVLGNRSYVSYLLTFSFAFAGLFAYISASPFVIQDVLGLSAGAYSVIFSLNALAITATSASAAFLTGRVSHRRLISVGLTGAALSSAGLLVVALQGVPTVPTLVLFACFQGSLGFIFGSATTRALEEAGPHTGTGSAFLGFLQYTLAALVSPLVGIAGEGTAVPMGVATVTAVALAVLSFTLIGRRTRPREDVRRVERVERARELAVTG